MLSLMLGLTAALSWGVHDFTVRYVSQRSRILPLILVVMICGAVLLAVPALVLGDWERMPAKAWGFAFASGVAYALGALGLYQAFAIGPVRLVAPITGSYPVLSLAWAPIGGAPTHLGQWLAVGAILAGIGAVAAWAAEDNSADTTPPHGDWKQWLGPRWALPALPRHLRLAILAPRPGLSCQCCWLRAWPACCQLLL